MLSLCMTIIDDDSEKALFYELFKGYKQRVFAVAKSILGSESLAEDSTQETFFYIAKNISRNSIENRMSFCLCSLYL